MSKESNDLHARWRAGAELPLQRPAKYWQHIDADIKEICRGLAQNQPLRLA
jgi:hypothetical protein